MAHVKLRTRDANRWCKKYPHVRVPKRPVQVGDRPVWMETRELHFDEAEQVSYIFETNFPGVPILSITGIDSPSNSMANVHFFIKSINKNSCVVGSSETFSGHVYIHAIYIAP